MATTVEPVKEQVTDIIPKRIKELKFGIASTQDIFKQGVVEVCARELFDLSRNRAPAHNGALDVRMGISDKTGFCGTCGEVLQTCNGHFGYIKLALPALHIGYLKMIITVLQDICKSCSHILLTESDRRQFLRDIRRPNIDNLRRTQICKKVNDQCRKTKICYVCGANNGRVKKAGTHPLKIIHEQFSHFENSKAMKKVPPAAKVEFDRSFRGARKSSDVVNRNAKKAVDDLNPLRILNLFKRISTADCELFGMDPGEGRPEMFIWQYFPVPPACIRPSVAQEGGSTEDDITSKVSDLAHVNNFIREGLLTGQPISTLVTQWDFLQLQIAMIINGDLAASPQQPGHRGGIRGFCQRLKGKQGRFRGNLSGKRVDFSGRTVISPDPNLGIDEVAIPELVAKNLTFPETVSRYNIDRMRECVQRGPNRWPGANYVWKKSTNIKQYLKYGKGSFHAQNLKIGDVVERHLRDRDIVLFNRQPSLHKLSILSHYVKIRPHRTFRLNECVCNPYNADFDGDEMNLHVPQTEEARAEAIELMGVKHNLATPKNGEPIISAIQDFITAAYLVSNKDVFYDRKTFTNICMYMVGANMQIDIPPPSILKPVMLWTGKQVFNVMMRPNKTSEVQVNLDSPCRQYRVVPGVPRDLNENDSWLCIRNSEVMCGVMDKSTIGSGKKDSVFYVILRDFGPDAAVQSMNRLARLSARWLTNQGFSIGIGDVYPGDKLTSLKQSLVEGAYAECESIIAKFKAGKLEKAAGCDEEQTMENKISSILSKVRQQAGDHCFAELSRWNSPMIMATSGSKGSNINVSQMVAVVGQQIIGGSRVADGFQDRSLPHFPKNARQPPSKGFVRNSFFSGLTPYEFYFHAISGREGLVDTAVKTAETGYMSRRLMKSLEDLSTNYDDTVRNSAQNIVQFQFGDDKLDPVDMEGKAKPVHFERTFTHAEATTWDNAESALLPLEIMNSSSTQLAPHRARLIRKNARNIELNYLDRSDDGIDDKESARDFLQSIEDFTSRKAQEAAAIRKRLGVSDGIQKSQRRSLHIGGQKKEATDYVERTAKISQTTLTTFIDACLKKYDRAKVEPGSAVGAVAAQSIGEPGTQMTLKTFHFAGVAGMSITQGVPRIKEIINASKIISTPVISCDLISKDEIAARVVKGRIEQTFLRDVIYHISDVWGPRSAHISMKLDTETIGRLQLDLTASDIAKIILKQKKLKLSYLDIKVYRNSVINVHINPIGKPKRGGTKTKAMEDNELFARVTNVKRMLPNVMIRGYSEASRAIIKANDNGKNSLLVEGYGLKNCMTTEGINPFATRTNSVMEMRDVLGIEAARKSIIDEIGLVMGDMDIDPRHMQLLADVMTYKGDVLGITRFGLSKMRDSVLQLASFEKTPDHLFEAAWHMKSDKIEGVSECIIMGQSMNLGTGAFKVARKLNLAEGVIGRKPCVFDDFWQETRSQRKRRG
ncbi:DNA-directed RNA polymerase III subunit C1 (rpo31) [Lecanora helva]